jgi:hypothetical protein
VQVIQDFERSFVALFSLLYSLCFRDALFLVGQVAFSGRYCFRCGFELFSLYKFAEVSGKRSRPFLSRKNTKNCSSPDDLFSQTKRLTRAVDHFRNLRGCAFLCRLRLRRDRLQPMTMRPQFALPQQEGEQHA